MKKLNCEVFEIIIEFDEKVFKTREFLERINLKKRKNYAFRATIGSKFKTKKEHSHFVLDLDGEDSSLRLSFHPIALDESEDEDENEKNEVQFYIETLSDWLSTFFESEILHAKVTATFIFNKKYKSRLQIGYPLLIESQYLRGAEIAGYEIDFPSDSLVKRASIWQTKKGFLVLLFGSVEINISSFNYLTEIENFSNYANALVIKRDEDDGTV